MEWKTYFLTYIFLADFSWVGLAWGCVMFDGFDTSIECFLTEVPPDQSWHIANTVLVKKQLGWRI